MKTFTKFTVTKAELVQSLCIYNADMICKDTLGDIKRFLLNDLSGNPQTERTAWDLIDDCLEEAGAIYINFNDESRIGEYVKQYFAILCPDAYERVTAKGSAIEEFAVEIVDQYGNAFAIVPGSECEW